MVNWIPKKNVDFFWQGHIGVFFLGGVQLQHAQARG